MKIRIRFPTKNRILYSYRDTRGFTWRKILAELIDNSLDAGAKHITATFVPGDSPKFVFEDDGKGVVQWEPMFAIGEHSRNDAVGIVSGQYGVGHKHAICAVWGVTKYESWCPQTGQRSECLMDWETLAKAEEMAWDIEAFALDTGSEKSSGLRITSSDIRKKLPARIDFDRMAEDLSFEFYPAIRRGALIKLVMMTGKQGRPRTRALAEFSLPDFEPVRVQKQFAVKGRTVWMDVGTVREDAENKRWGIHVFRAHRMIRKSSNMGCGDVNPSNIFGLVELGQDWPTATHKDDMPERESVLLEEALHEHMQPVLERAKAMVSKLKIYNLEKLISADMMASLEKFGYGKAKRGKGDKEGTIRPTGKGSSHKHATVVQPVGDTIIRRITSRGVNVNVVDGEVDRDGLGKVELRAKQPISVFLYKNHPAIAERMPDNFRAVQEETVLAAIAFSLLAERIHREYGAAQLDFFKMPKEIEMSDVTSRFAVIMGLLFTKSGALTSQQKEEAEG